MSKPPVNLIDARDIQLTPDTPVLKAIEVLERSKAKIVLVVNTDGKLVGSATDGDVRRGFLRGCTVNSPVRDVMHTTPYTLPLETTRQQILEIMQAMDIRQVPLVRPDGTVAGIVTRDFLLGQAHTKRDNPVVIMAGGKGTRLMPLTTYIPKPMVEVSGRPILEWIIHRFTKQGFTDFHIAINHLGHVIEEYFGDGGKHSCQINYVREKDFLGTAGALALLDKAAFNEPIIVINGDIMASIDFGSVVEYHIASGGIATVCVRPHRIEVPYGVVEIKDGMLQTIVEKPVREDLVSAGIYVIDPEVLDYIPAGKTLDMPSLLSALVQHQKKVAVFPMREDWIDVGRHDDLEQAKHAMAKSAS